MMREEEVRVSDQTAALKMEGTTSQGVMAAPGRWERKQILHSSFQKEPGPTDTLISALETHLGPLTLRTVRSICVLCPTTCVVICYSSDRRHREGALAKRDRHPSLEPHFSHLFPSLEHAPSLHTGWTLGGCPPGLPLPGSLPGPSS